MILIDQKETEIRMVEEAVQADIQSEVAFANAVNMFKNKTGIHYFPEL